MLNAAIQVTVAQMGARMHYAVPEILHGARMLHRLFTDAYADTAPFRVLQYVPGCMQPRFLRRLRARRARLPARMVRAFQAFGLQYAWKRTSASSPSDAAEVDFWAGARFNELIIKEGLNGADCVYGFNSASEALLSRARQLGIKTVLEQTVLPATARMRLLAEERERWPGWEEDGEGNGFASLLANREQAEWELADIIVCGSEYVAEGVVDQGGDRAKCKVVPYGVGTALFAPAATAPTRAQGPLRVLFVGSIGLRKGIPYLLQAASRLKGSEAIFRLVGPVVCDRQALLSRRPQNVHIVGPVARSEIMKQYQWADVLCLPTLCEGSATVTYEALAAGLPVITTQNAGSTVRDSVEGFIIPIRDSEAIAQRISTLLTDRQLLAQMSNAAVARSEHGSLVAYAERLLHAVQDLLCSTRGHCQV